MALGNRHLSCLLIDMFLVTFPQEQAKALLAVYKTPFRRGRKSSN
jgi:hypothetical protein